MPGYSAHTSINLLALGGTCYVAAVHYEVEAALIAAGAAAFAVATFLLSPDLDLKHSSPTKNWGLMRWLWRPYQMLFKHRGLSHSLLFSSATRIGYLICVLSAALIGMHAWADPSPAALLDSGTLMNAYAQAALVNNWKLIAAAGAGIAFSDTCHIVTDRFFSTVKAAGKFLFW